MVLSHRLGVLICGFVTMLWLSRSNAFIELNAFYFSSDSAVTASTKTSRLFLEGTIGFKIDQSAQYLIGWGIASHSTEDSGAFNESYTSLQMGPRFLWMIGKEKNWSLGVAYYLIARANHDSAGSGSEEWRGATYHADFGYNYAIDGNSCLSARINYSLASYNEKLVGSNYSKLGYDKTYIYPSVAYVYIF